MRIRYLAACAGLLFSSSLWTADAHHHLGGTTASAPATQAYRATGTVKQWDDASVTLAHVPIAELRWPAMTMAFRLPPELAAALLAAGTPVDFSFSQSDSGYTLTAIAPQHH